MCEAEGLPVHNGVAGMLHTALPGRRCRCVGPKIMLISTQSGRKTGQPISLGKLDIRRGMQNAGAGSSLECAEHSMLNVPGASVVENPDPVVLLPARTCEDGS